MLMKAQVRINHVHAYAYAYAYSDVSFRRLND